MRLAFLISLLCSFLVLCGLSRLFILLYVRLHVAFDLLQGVSMFVLLSVFRFSALAFGPSWMKSITSFGMGACPAYRAGVQIKCSAQLSGISSVLAPSRNALC